VGGRTLATLVRETRHSGCVTACGVVGGATLPLTVYPFVLRGITLTGIDSAVYPAERRPALWRRLAGPWRIDQLESLATTTRLADLEQYISRILRGEIVGRVLVDLDEP
jgi:acrylyl-CoA reductase (NADPH)